MEHKQKIKVRVIKAENSMPSMKYNAKTDSKQQETELLEVLNPKYDMALLREYRETSTVLGQCVDAYKWNIAGFGFSQAYGEGQDNSKETPEMRAEWDRLKSVLKYMSIDKPLKEVFEQAIEHREECGNAFLEVIRNGTDQPAELLNITPETIRITKYTAPALVEYMIDGVKVQRRKKFRRYVQMDSGIPRVWFKQFGDPRVMDCRDGTFNDNTPSEYQATEILHLKIGDGVYGVPRWVSQLIHMSGSRKADELNYLYFKQGRHTPAAIMISNGSLTDDSEAQLSEYMGGVEGSDNAHKFLLLQVESVDEYDQKEDEQKAKIEIKPLAEMLQQDALFLDYDKSSRDKVRSAFRLPGVYIGETNDYNRATIKTAKEVTEEQVFIPERETLEFLINDLLLAPYGFRYVRASVNGPDMTDTEDVISVLETLNNITAVAPNDVRDLLAKALGKPIEPFKDAKYDLPISKDTVKRESVLKAAGEPSELTLLLKDLRDVLEEMQHDQAG